MSGREPLIATVIQETQNAANRSHYFLVSRAHTYVGRDTLRSTTRPRRVGLRVVFGVRDCRRIPSGELRVGP